MTLDPRTFVDVTLEYPDVRQTLVDLGLAHRCTPLDPLVAAIDRALLAHRGAPDDLLRLARTCAEATARTVRKRNLDERQVIARARRTRPAPWPRGCDPRTELGRRAMALLEGEAS